ncbi:SCO1664 family protein [Corynebacterium lubricantis]|uniref:SCO1664 family protein n=1 Tax=Corynebacterium lubricantis TaxID=541095 RepID=UPI00037D28D2|nr:SCO1664 family protein [Corynebacterium lubricantis]
MSFERELNLLSEGEIGWVAQLPESSNAAYVLDVTLGDDYAWAVYKPTLGEQPLMDFPPGLHRRERAAFVLSDFLGWDIVPPTVIRDVEPFGAGSLQLFIEHEGWHYFPLFEEREDLHPVLLRMAVFDLLTNNTDRKSGHVLLGAGDHVWGIDQGLCFHMDPKLRTVIWDFAGEAIPDELASAVESLLDEVPAELEELLSEEEVAALKRRASRIVRLPFLPQPRNHYQYPWPLV